MLTNLLIALGIISVCTFFWMVVSDSDLDDVNWFIFIGLLIVFTIILIIM